MQDADRLEDDGEIAARVELASYLLRCTSNVVTVTPGGDLSASVVTARLARALAGERGVAAAIIDATTAHDAGRLAERLLLDEGTDPGEPAAADQLARRLKMRDLALAVVVEDSHGLSVRILQNLLILSRLVSERGARMPVALICPGEEADRMELLAQETGRDADQIQRIRLRPPAGTAGAVLNPPRHRRFHPAWIATPLGVVVAGMITYQLFARGSDTETTKSADSAPVPGAAVTESPQNVSTSLTKRADDEVTADVNSAREDASETPSPPVVTLPAEIASASALFKRAIPPLPDRTAASTAHQRASAAVSTLVAEIPPAVAEAIGGENAAQPDAAGDAEKAAANADSEPENDSPPEATQAVASTPKTDAAWLAARDSGRYTLQLIAGRKAQTTANFLEAHPEIRKAARVVTVNGEEGAWHLVLIGDYVSRAVAIRNVPASIGADNAYPRRFAALQD